MPARPAVNLAAVVMTPVVTLLGGGLYSVLVAPRLDRAQGGSGAPDPMERE